MAMLRERPMLRLKDFMAAGIAPQTLARLVADAAVERPLRGLYRLPDGEVDARHTLAQAAALVPRGVVCLTSALQFHGLTLQMPKFIWMAVSRAGAMPRISKPKIRFVRVQPEAMTSNIKRHRIDGIDVAVTEPARTIVDCFRARNTIGLDVALEGLRRGLSERTCKPAELERLAREQRVWSVLEPYLTALVADGD